MNPCPEGTKVERVFNVVGIQVPIIYNEEGWNDPEGRIFVLEEDEEDVLSGRKNQNLLSYVRMPVNVFVLTLQISFQKH